MTNENSKVQDGCTDFSAAAWIRIITVPKPEDVRPTVVTDFSDGGSEEYDCGPDLWDKDILFFPREWSPDPDVHMNVYDEDDQDAMEVRPAGAIAQWIRNNVEFTFFSVAANEIRVILNQRQATLIRDRFGLYPPAPACATEHH
jgi:hypothetical protein